MCACEPGECHVCATLVTSYLLDHEKEGTRLSVLVFVLYVGAVEGCALSVALCGTRYVNALCVVSGIHAQFYYSLNLKTGYC